jgi:hypothetical protein
MKTTIKFNNATMKKALFFIYCSLFTGLAPCLAQNPLLVCNSKGFTLTSVEAANGAKNVTYKWYENGTEQTSKTDATLHVNSGKTAGTYEYVRKAFSEDCPEGVPSNTFTVVVLATPTAPVITPSPATVCYGAGNVEFSITEADNTTYTWTKVAGDNGALSGGKNLKYTLSSPSAATHTVKATATLAYTVDVQNKSCVSGYSAEVSAVVHPLPEVTPGGPFARCGAGELPLSVTAQAGGSSDGITVKWYGANSDQGTELHTGLSYTPSLNTLTTTYYVGATVDATGCKSASLAEVAAKVNVLSGTIGGTEDEQ